VLVLSASAGWCSLVFVLMCPNCAPGIAVSARVVGRSGAVVGRGDRMIRPKPKSPAIPGRPRGLVGGALCVVGCVTEWR